MTTFRSNTVSARSLSRVGHEGEAPASRGSSGERAYSPDRLRRAWQLVRSGRVQQVGQRQFRVAGNVEPEYAVDLDEDPPCYCRDMEHRGGKIRQNCKHVLSARLALLDAGLLNVIAESLEFTERTKGGNQ